MLFRSHHSREELHHENFVVKREAFVVTVENIVELLAKRLGIVEELNGREVGGRRVRLLLLFLCRHVRLMYLILGTGYELLS